MGAGVQWNERPEQSRGALNFSFREIGRLPSAMAEEVLTGLRQQPKAISPKYFYDTEGSRLFSRICELSEYYPTRDHGRGPQSGRYGGSSRGCSRHIGFLLLCRRWRPGRTQWHLL